MISGSHGNVTCGASKRTSRLPVASRRVPQPGGLGHPHQPLKALERSPLGAGGRISTDHYKVPPFELLIVGTGREIRDNSEQNMLARRID